MSELPDNRKTYYLELIRCVCRRRPSSCRTGILPRVPGCTGIARSTQHTLNCKKRLKIAVQMFDRAVEAASINHALNVF